MPATAEHVANVKNKRQMTIPLQVRRKLDLPGDRIVVRVTDTAVDLEPARVTLEDTFASVMPRELPEDFAALRDAAIEDHVLQVVQEMQE